MGDLFRATKLIQVGSIIEYTRRDRMSQYIRARGIVVRIRIHRSHFLTQLVIMHPHNGPDIICMGDVCNLIAV